MTIINTLKVYESLKAQMPERSAKAVAEALESSFEEFRMNQGEMLATKEDLAVLRSDLRTEIAAVRSDLRTEIAGVRADLIKWMFIFWVGQIGVTVTLILSLR